MTKATPGTTHPPIRKLELPRSRRRYRFMLTPFADTMFQLLIFFMLSANLTPYSLLSIRNGALAAPGGAMGTDTGGQRAVSDPMATAVWSVGADSIVSNGQRFGLEQIPALARALQIQETPEVLLISQRGASVQMLVAILDILSNHGLTAIRVADGSGA